MVEKVKKKRGRKPKKKVDPVDKPPPKKRGRKPKGGKIVKKAKQNTKQIKMKENITNENMEELVELYVSVCEMEYFPMECEMKGILIGSILSVQEFEILYIQGCGE